jgi:hypothetical protein
MIRFASSILAFALFACGGAAEGDDLFEDDYSDLGQAEQPFHGKRTPSFQYGTRTATSRQKCDRSSTGQVCAIPPSKTLTYCVEPAGTVLANWTNAERNRVSAIIEGLDAISDFTLNPVDSFGFSCLSLSPQPQVLAFTSSTGSSGTGSSDVKDYAHSGMFNFTDLTEGAGIVGAYQTWGGCEIRLDIVDIRAKGTSATQDNNGVDHAAAHTLMACLGIGGRSGDGGRASRNLFNPATTATNVSTGEACQMTGFTLSSPGQFNNSLTGDCASD